MVDGIGRAQKTNVQTNKTLQPLQSQGTQGSVQNLQGLSTAKEGFSDLGAVTAPRPFAELLREQTASAAPMALTAPTASSVSLSSKPVNTSSPKPSFSSKNSALRNTVAQEILQKKPEQNKTDDEKPGRARQKKELSPKALDETDDAGQFAQNQDPSRIQIGPNSAFAGATVEGLSDQRIPAVFSKADIGAQMNSDLQKGADNLSRAAIEQRVGPQGSNSKNTAAEDTSNTKTQFYRLSTDLKKQLGFEIEGKLEVAQAIAEGSKATALDKDPEYLQTEENQTLQSALTAQEQNSSSPAGARQIFASKDETPNETLSQATSDLNIGALAGAKASAVQIGLPDQTKRELDVMNSPVAFENSQAIQHLTRNSDNFEAARVFAKADTLPQEADSRVEWNPMHNTPLTANDLADALSDPLADRGSWQSALFSKKEFLENYKKLASAFDDATLTFQSLPDTMNASVDGNGALQAPITHSDKNQMTTGPLLSTAPKGLQNQSETLGAFDLQSYRPEALKNYETIAGASNTPTWSLAPDAHSQAAPRSSQTPSFDSQALNAPQTLARQQTVVSSTNIPGNTSQNGTLNSFALQQSTQSTAAQSKQNSYLSNSRNSLSTLENFDTNDEWGDSKTSSRGGSLPGSAGEPALSQTQNPLQNSGASSGFNGSGAENQGDRRNFGSESMRLTLSQDQSAQDSANALTETIRARTNEIVDRMIVQGGTGQAKLSLRDSMVGSVDVTVAVGAGKKLSVEIKADKSDTKEKIESQLEALKDSLKGHEFKSVEITLGTEKNSSGNGSSSQQGRQNETHREAMSQNQNGFLGRDQGSSQGQQNEARELLPSRMQNIDRQGEALGKRVYAERSKASVNQKGNLSFRA